MPKTPPTPEPDMPTPAPQDRDDLEPASPPQASGTLTIPNDSTPTWQAELLLSGGIVLA
jgi:hypothetical protein